jgi:hypothetical protein
MSALAYTHQHHSERSTTYDHVLCVSTLSVKFSSKGRTTAQAVSRRFPTAGTGFEPRSNYVGFVVDKVALGQVFSEYSGFPCQFPFHRLLHTHHLSSGAGTIDQLVADVPSGLSLTPPRKTKQKQIFPYASR